MKRLLAGLLVTSALVASGSNAGLAQATSSPNGIEEVVVTASKTGAQSVQKSAFAVSAFTVDQVHQEQIINVKDLVAYTPNLQVAQAQANAEIFIRGIGNTNVFAGSDPDVTVQVDGVYLARPVAQFADFADIQRIEVLRGPQGTLYGRNAAGGTINVISLQPTDTFTAKGDVSLGAYGLFQTRDFISGSLGNRVQASLSVNYQRHDEYISNIAPDGHDIDGANHGSVRGQLRIELTDNLDATTRADWSQADEFFESYDQLLAPNLVPPTPLANSTISTFRTVALNTPQELFSHSGGVSEEINYRLTSALSLKSISAYRESWNKVTSDSDATEANTSISQQSEIQHQASEELTAQYSSTQFQAVVGLYYFNEHIKSAIASSTPATNILRSTSPRVGDESKAAYAQGTYNITDALHLTLGARYTQESKNIFTNAFTLNTATGALIPPSFNTPGFSRYSAFTPKVGVDYQLLDNVFLYASVTKGYKSGGFNYAARNVALQKFGPEKIISYEGGVKSEWFDNRLRANLTGFAYHYTGLQIQSLLSPGNAFIGNAKSASVRGLELETIAKPFPGFTLTSNVSLLNATYGPFPNASVPAGLTPYVIGNPRYNPATGFFDATGNTLNLAPHYSGLEAAQYDYNFSEGLLYGRVEYSWQTRTYYDPSNAKIMSQGGYGLWNMAIGYQPSDSPWAYQALVRNAGDKQYLITTAALGAVPTGHAGPPRTVWFSISRNW